MEALGERCHGLAGGHDRAGQLRSAAFRGRPTAARHQAAARFVAAGLGEPGSVDVSGVLAALVDTTGLVERSQRGRLPAAPRLGLTTAERSREFLTQPTAAAGARDRLVMLPRLVACWARRSAR
jgi:hypothetical protein